jgi:hypothetical protein
MRSREKRGNRGRGKEEKEEIKSKGKRRVL